MKNSGFSLIEVLIAMALMGILLVVAVPKFNDMQTKSRIEKQTREMYAAIVSTRLTAIQNKQRNALFLGPNQFVFKVYTSANDSLADAWKTMYTTNLPHEIQKMGSSTALDVTSDKIEFDTRGFTINYMTLVVKPEKYGGGKNCIKVHTARTNIGRLDSATTCTIQ